MRKLGPVIDRRRQPICASVVPLTSRKYPGKDRILKAAVMPVDRHHDQFRPHAPMCWHRDYDGSTIHLMGSSTPHVRLFRGAAR
ncbi:hypothetical protein TNCV_2359361 [Trichonephila clavipes]|nr:hypothetical protein TNCV_2359361 [Trichonephila clavipes]